MIKVSVRGLDEVRRRRAERSKEAKFFAEGKVAEYLVGDERHGLKHEPYYKHVNRYAGFPEASYTAQDGHEVVGWHSLKQQQYVMASIREGRITPGVENRSHTLRDGWKAAPVNNTFWRISNDVPYANYVMGDEGQTRMHALIGWRRYSVVVASNLKGAFRHAQAELKKWFASRWKR
jgi:hypothetical protein